MSWLRPWSWLAALPLFVVEIPPILDYPNHLARLWLLSMSPPDPILSSMYAPDWHLLPNLAIDAICRRCCMSPAVCRGPPDACRDPPAAGHRRGGLAPRSPPALVVWPLSSCLIAYESFPAGIHELPAWSRCRAADDRGMDRLATTAAAARHGGAVGRRCRGVLLPRGSAVAAWRDRCLHPGGVPAHPLARARRCIACRDAWRCRVRGSIRNSRISISGFVFWNCCGGTGGTSR